MGTQMHKFIKRLPETTFREALKTTKALLKLNVCQWIISYISLENAEKIYEEDFCVEIAVLNFFFFFSRQTFFPNYYLIITVL